MTELCNKPPCQIVKELFAKNDPEKFEELMARTRKLAQCDPLWCVPALQMTGNTQKEEEK